MTLPLNNLPYLVFSKWKQKQILKIRENIIEFLRRFHKFSVNNESMNLL